MGEILVNFADVQTKSVVAAGDYPAVVSDCVLRQKAGAEHPYLNWDLVIAEGEHEGRHVFMTTSFNPAAMWKMMQAFGNLGYADEEYKLQFDDTTGQVTEPEVIGLACTAQVYQEPYQNRMTAKVSSILGPNGEDILQGAGEAEAASAAAASSPAARPATKAPKAAPAAKNGPAPAGAAAKRSPFPAAQAGTRRFA